MSAAERAGALEEIKRLKARYFRAMDEQDWGAFQELFTTDAMMDMSGSGGAVPADAVIHGAERITRAVSRFLAHARTVHHGHMPEIELTSATAAEGVWAMEDRLWRADGSEHGYGHYHDTYARVDGVWRIRSTKLVRLRVEA
jgi:SnoaL-like domain